MSFHAVVGWSWPWIIEAQQIGPYRRQGRAGECFVLPDPGDVEMYDNMIIRY